MKNVFYLICFLLLSHNVRAQFEIVGKVLTNEKEPLGYASVVLLKLSDSSIVAYTLAKEDGSFTLELKDSSSYLLQYSFLGYESQINQLKADWNEKEIQLPAVYLQKSSFQLQTVEIVGERIPMKMKGDTLVYDAAAFKVNVGADVEELLEQLPGLSLDQEGNLIAQGEKVERVLIDGKEFFGDDPKMLIKNLDAEAIQLIEVLDKQSETAEFTGVEDGEEMKTINLTLKEEFKKGQFGKTEIAGGTAETYRAKVNYNRFNKNTQLSFIGNTNNLNDQSFSFGDYNDFAGGSFNAAGSGGGGGNNGINSTYLGGLNLNHDFNSKLKSDLSYTYRQSKNEIESVINTQNFSLEEEFETAQTNEDLRSQITHTVNANLRWELDSFTQISFRSNVNVRDNQSENESKTIYTPATANGSLISNVLNKKDLSLNSNTSLNLNRRFRKTGRNWLNAYNVYYQKAETINELQSSIFGEEIDQYQDFGEKQLRNSLSSTYTEPLSEKWYASFGISLKNESNEPSFLFFDNNQGERNLNDSLSAEFSREVREGQLLFRLRRNSEKLNINLSAELAQINLNTNDLDRTFNFIYPKFRVHYRIKKTQNISLNYNTRSSTPSLGQLVAIPNNTNPNSNYFGNLDLVPEFTHSVNMSYSWFQMDRSISFNSGINYSFTSDKIVNQTIVNSDFTSRITPVNTGFYENRSMYTSLSGEVKKLNLFYELNPSYNFSNYDAFLNGEATRVKTEGFNSNFAFGPKKKESWGLKIGLNYSINFTNYEVNSNFNQRFSNFDWYAKGEIDITKKLLFSWRYTLRRFNAVSFSEERLLHFVDASLKYVFQKEKWSVYLLGKDILNQNIGLQRANGVNTLTESNFNTRTQYFMLGLSRKFR